MSAGDSGQEEEWLRPLGDSCTAGTRRGMAEDFLQSIPEVFGQLPGGEHFFAVPLQHRGEERCPRRGLLPLCQVSGGRERIQAFAANVREQSLPRGSSSQPTRSTYTITAQHPIWLAFAYPNRQQFAAGAGRVVGGRRRPLGLRVSCDEVVGRERRRSCAGTRLAAVCMARDEVTCGNVPGLDRGLVPRRLDLPGDPLGPCLIPADVTDEKSIAGSPAGCPAVGNGGRAATFVAAN